MTALDQLQFERLDADGGEWEPADAVRAVRILRDAYPGATDDDLLAMLRQGQVRTMFAFYRLAALHPLPYRAIITVARRMMRTRGWTRCRAVAFAVEKYRRDPEGFMAPKPRRRTARNDDFRQARSEDALEHLQHRNRTLAR